MVDDFLALRNAAGDEDWRLKESLKLGDLVQRRLEYLQVGTCRGRVGGQFLNRAGLLIPWGQAGDGWELMSQWVGMLVSQNSLLAAFLIVCG